MPPITLAPPRSALCRFLGPLYLTYSHSSWCGRPSRVFMFSSRWVQISTVTQFQARLPGFLHWSRVLALNSRLTSPGSCTGNESLLSIPGSPPRVLALVTSPCFCAAGGFKYTGAILKALSAGCASCSFADWWPRKLLLQGGPSSLSSMLFSSNWSNF